MLWGHAILPRSAAYPCYTRLNQILDEANFHGYVEGLCRRFYGSGWPARLPPGRYFRLLLIAFEGLEAERAIAWRTADSFALREFLGLGIARGAAGSFDDFAHASLDRSPTRAVVTTGC